MLLTPHFANLELGGRFMARRVPIVITYKPNKDPYLDRLIRNNRLAHKTTADHDVLPARDVRGMLRILRRGGVIWYAPDINYKGASGSSPTSSACRRQPRRTRRASPLTQVRGWCPTRSTVAMMAVTGW